MLRSSEVWIRCLWFVLMALLPGCRGETAGVPGSSPVGQEDRGPVVAAVGEREIRLRDLNGLSRAALQVRESLGLEAAPPDSPSQELELAAEISALAAAATEAGAAGDPGVTEQQKRMLARLYLTRALDPLGRDPVSEQEIRRVHEREVQRFLQTGDSGLFLPTRLDASAISIGFFPDLHSPREGETPVVSVEQAEALATEIRNLSGERVSDLDRFLAIGRQFMRGHPTVQIKDFVSVPLDPSLVAMDRILHQAIVGLDGRGAISQSVRSDGGVFVFRRGVTYPGRGEQLDSIRPALEARVRRERQRSALDDLLATAKRRLGVRTWPERLRLLSGSSKNP